MIIFLFEGSKIMTTFNLFTFFRPFCCGYCKLGKIILMYRLFNQGGAFSHKAMLHEVSFPATYNTMNVALQVSKNNCPCNTPFSRPAMQQNVTFVLRAKDNYPVLLVSLRDNLLRVTCQAQLAMQSFLNEPIRARLSLIGNILRWRPKSVLPVTNTICECVTSPLQLAMFFFRQCCIASCRKNCLA